MLYMLQSHYNNVIECSKHQFLSGRRAVRAVTSACFAETSACHAKADFLLVSSIMDSLLPSTNGSNTGENDGT